MVNLKKITALFLVVITIFLSLCSCRAVENMIDAFTPQDPDLEGENKDPSGNDPDSPKRPVNTEPTEHITSVEEKNRQRYGYMPHRSDVLPSIRIDTPDKSNDWAKKYNRDDKIAGNIDYVDATVSVTDCEEEYLMTDAVASVKVRGNYTLQYDKKPIRIKFDKKANMLGLNEGGKFKNWVLLADYKDLSLTNNAVAFYLGNLILGSDGYYCTDFRHVQVYLNGEYWGVYLLVEQQEVKEGRTSLPEVPDDYTGYDVGYFFEFDGYYNLEGPDGDPTFVMNHMGVPAGNSGYTVKSDINDPSQLEFLKKYMDNAYYIAYQACYKGKFYEFNSSFTGVSQAKYARNAREAVERVIDIQSLVDTYILNEIAKDLDIDWSSLYLSLDMSPTGNRKITFEAPWDFDSCFGIISRENCSATEGMYASTEDNPWFQLVKDQDWFWGMVKQKWSEMKKYGVLNRTISFIIDERAFYGEYFIENFERWPNRVKYGDGECVGVLNSYKDINTAQNNAAEYLINWLNKRFLYLDSRWLIEGDDPFKTVVDNSPTRPVGFTAYRLEAEEGELSCFLSDDPVKGGRLYASGGKYLSDMVEGASVSFDFNIEKAGMVYVYISVAKRDEACNFADCFSVTINGRKYKLTKKIISAVEGDEEAWHSFVCLNIANFYLTGGNNNIKITALRDTTNIDYIELHFNGILTTE